MMLEMKLKSLFPPINCIKLPRFKWSEAFSRLDLALVNLKTKNKKSPPKRAFSFTKED
jgi:hypothetical protein